MFEFHDISNRAGWSISALWNRKKQKNKKKKTIIRICSNHALIRSGCPSNSNFAGTFVLVVSLGYLLRKLSHHFLLPRPWSDLTISPSLVKIYTDLEDSNFPRAPRISPAGNPNMDNLNSPIIQNLIKITLLSFCMLICCFNSKFTKFKRILLCISVFVFYSN